MSWTLLKGMFKIHFSFFQNFRRFSTNIFSLATIKYKRGGSSPPLDTALISLSKTEKVNMFQLTVVHSFPFNFFRYKWAIPYLSYALNRKQERCLVLLKAPECKPAPWSRHNHLGNGADLEPLRYDWIMPHFPHLGNERRAFVLRIR